MRSKANNKCNEDDEHVSRYLHLKLGNLSPWFPGLYVRVTTSCSEILTVAQIFENVSNTLVPLLNFILKDLYTSLYSIFL